VAIIKQKNVRKLFAKTPKWLKIALIPFILYVIWNIIGLILVEINLVKKFPVGFNTVITNEDDDYDGSKADFDGPYILYSENKTFIKKVLRKDTLVFAQIDTIYGSIKGREIKCYVNNNISFSTYIKDTLINEPSIYTSTQKLMALSDIEGDFEAFTKMLINNNVIDKDYNWIFGKGDLVLNGDFFDRGLNVTECLWLIYSLEQQAKEQGGKVHFILGNHEIMNMNNDLRYVRNKYIENASLIKENYSELYQPNTELGRWLQTKNIVEKIGNYLFVHAGISEELNKLHLPIESINSIARKFYFKSEEARNGADKTASTIYHFKNSPFWYRGYAKEQINKDDLQNILQNYKVEKVIIGHTVTENVKYIYDKKIINIDTKHSEGNSQGLLVENGKEFRIDINGNKFEIQ